MVQSLEIVRGTTVVIALEVTTASGTTYPHKTGDVVLFGVKENLTDSQPIFGKTAVKESSEGRYKITLDPEDTADLKPGQYWYDVGLQSGENFFNVVPLSPFTVLSNVTRKGDNYG